MSEKSRLRIAMQKSGRLSQESQKLLSDCGIKINLQKQKLLSYSKNMPIDIIRVRDDDIPGLIIDKIVDLGIIGKNVFEEKLLSRSAQGEISQYRILRNLDFGRCRLSIALPFNTSWKTFKKSKNKKIATSYPYLLKKYLKKSNINFQPCLLNGSVEVATKVGLADAICDLVSTGSTLEENGLYEAKTIYRSQACLIQREGKLNSIKKMLIQKFLLRIEGIIQAKESKYIMMHVPKKKVEKIIKLLSGIEYPTILPLSKNKKKLVLHMVGSETAFWKTIENLKYFGASSILVLPIEKMIK